MSKPKASPSAQSLLQAAARLPESERLKLISQLTAMTGAPAGFPDLSEAFKLHHLTLGWGFLRDADKPRARRISEKLGSYFHPTMTKRQRAAVLAALVRQAKVSIGARGKAIHVSSVLELLDDEDWNVMLDRAYPGYPIATLGAVLCGSLTG